MFISSGRLLQAESRLSCNIVLILNATRFRHASLLNSEQARAGFQSQAIRRAAWVRLCNITELNSNFREELRTPHPSSEQIQRDIERSLTYISHSRKWKRHTRDAKREQLSAIINGLVRREKDLHYYQGLHDVVAVLLLVTGDEQVTFALLQRLCSFYFKEFMRETFKPLSIQMQLLPALLKRFDSEVAAFIENLKIEPYYALPWCLTWFAHDVHNLNVIARLYDTLMTSHTLYIFYLSAAVVLHSKDKLLQLEPDFATVHDFLARLPQSQLPWSAILQQADLLLQTCPPRELLMNCTTTPKLVSDAILQQMPNVLVYPPPWFELPSASESSHTNGNTELTAVQSNGSVDDAKPLRCCHRRNSDSTKGVNGTTRYLILVGQQVSKYNRGTWSNVAAAVAAVCVGYGATLLIEYGPTYLK
jgi:Rab-GTPase-TBC domain